MPRDLHSVLQAHQQQLRDESPWVWVYDFQVPTDPLTRYRITNYTEPVPLGTDPEGMPILYSPYPIDHGEIELTREGDLPSIRVSIANSRNDEIGATLEEYGGLLGEPAVVRLINIAAGGTSSAQVRFDAQVSRVRMTHEIVTIELAAENLRKARFPRRRYLRSHCPFQFGDADCGYTLPAAPGEAIGDGFSFCPKSLEGCTDRGLDEVARALPQAHPERFGGFLGIGRAIR